MEFNIPEPLKEEHDELHAELARITKVGGSIGEAAKKVAEVMHPHFIKEEEYALPPIGLLSSLSKGDCKPEIGSACTERSEESVLQMTDRLKAMLPQMLAEHIAIVDALLKLTDVATKENRMEFAFFARRLILHIRTEEEVLYPASILVGKYLKLKLNK